MKIIIDKDSQTSSYRVAREIAKLIKQNPSAILGLATGSTPVKVYSILAEMCAKKEISFAKVSSFNLDEYVGLSPDNDQSYRYFMNENLFDKVDIDKAHTRVPDGLAKDIPTTCEAYERAIEEAGGVDFQLLGIGSDGHIGFNEPSSSFASKTRMVSLTAETIQANARFFNNDISAVPTHAITMGISTIMKAKKVCLMAYGADKATAVAEMIEGAMRVKVPASVLQMHPNVQIFLDEAAASKLELRDYYNGIKADLIARGEID